MSVVELFELLSLGDLLLLYRRTIEEAGWCIDYNGAQTGQRIGQEGAEICCELTDVC